MGAPSIDLGGVTIWAPITVGTNLALCLQCAWYHALLRSAGPAARGFWGLFFLWMAVATLAGAVKHGLRPDLGPWALSGVHWVSSVGGGLAVLSAQRATIRRSPGRRAGRWLERACTLQLLCYLVASTIFGPLVGVLIANTAVGLFPVIFTEADRARRGVAGATWIAGGLGLSTLTALIYLFQISPAAWLSHVDVAHGLMGVSYWLVLQGVSTAGVEPCYPPPRGLSVRTS